MKLTVLGGGAAGPNTGQGCSGYLVTDGETRLVLDLGPGTLLELRKHADYRTLDGIVVSHVHLDHVLDLLALRFTLAYNPIPAPLPIPLWLPLGGTAVLRQAGAAFASPGATGDFFSPMFALAEYDPASSIEAGDLTVTFTPAVHPLPCWAIRVASAAQPGRDLVYTADTGPSADIAGFGAGAAVLLAEATWPVARDEPFESRGHLTPQDAGSIATAVGAETLVLTHMFEESDPEQAKIQAANTFAGKIDVAQAGLTIQW